MPLRRMAACLVAALVVAGSAAASGAEVKEQTLSLITFPAPLHGTLISPKGSGPFPGVLILGDSGPLDRNGNVPGGRNAHLKLLAQDLAARGIAALRIDKRGIGDSAAAAPDKTKLTFHTYVSDAVRWLDRLRAVPSVGHVFMLGYGGEALAATMAAQQVHPDGLVLLAGAGRPASVTIRRQLNVAGLSPALRESAERILTALEHKKTVPKVPPTLAGMFRPSVQPYVMSWLPIDPVAELAKVTVPTLVVQGNTDLQVTMDDARRLAAARPGITLVTIEGMNHVLKLAQAEHATNIVSDSDAKLPLAPKLVPTITDFIARR